MRIIGGAWRGRRLDAVRGDQVRPTTDRVRESLFNLLAGEVTGAAVVDLCCGSGALGLEALSRGAARVDFVDLAPQSLATVRANLERCEATPETWALHRADAARWLIKRLEAGGVPLLILADPPYGGQAAMALERAILAGPPSAVLVAVLERPADAREIAAAPELWLLDVRTYGRTALTLIRPRDPVELEARHD